jgi:hypothetical protein
MKVDTSPIEALIFGATKDKIADITAFLLMCTLVDLRWSIEAIQLTPSDLEGRYCAPCVLIKDAGSEL